MRVRTLSNWNPGNSLVIASAHPSQPLGAGIGTDLNAAAGASLFRPHQLMILLGALSLSLNSMNP